MLDALAPLWTFFARHAYVVAFIVTAIDATGIPFPGRVLLVAAGALAATGDANLIAIIVVAAAGAVIGDHVWYALGRWRGQAIVELGCRVTFRPRSCVERANAVSERFGPFAIVIGRFFTAIRVLVTAMAASRMPYYRYLLSEIAGALVWSALFVLIGYGAGGYGATMLDGRIGGTVLLVILGGGLVAFAAAVAYRLVKRGRATSVAPAAP
jgi:membrane protein DedA with SNARE-associated domain